MLEKRGETRDSSAGPDIGSKKLLGELTRKKIAYYQSKSSPSDVELYSVVKDFFSELLEIKYEYTFGELIKEIENTYFEQKIKDKIIFLISKLRGVEYRSNAYTEDEIRSMFKEFDLLVPFILKTNQADKKNDFISKLTAVFAKKEKKAQEINTEELLQKIDDLAIEEEKVEEEVPEEKKVEEIIESINPDNILPEIEEKTEPVETAPIILDDWTEETGSDISEMIKKAKKTRKKDVLKNQYLKIDEIYEGLPNSEKHKYFDDVHKLYEKYKKIR